MCLRKISTISLFALLLMVHLTTVEAAESYASQKFQYALGECEKGLDASTPTTRSSLRILKLSLKRYERSRDAALRKDVTLPKSQDLMATEGSLNDKTLAEAFQICEDTLAGTIEEAEVHVAELLEERKARLSRNHNKVEALREKMEAAKAQVTIAVNQSCTRIMQQATNIDPRRLQAKFKKAKQKALETYPNIVKQFHRIVLKDPETGDEQKITKTVQGWFIHCNTLFDEALGLGNQHAGDATDEEVTEDVVAMSPEMDDETDAAENMDVDEEDANITMDEEGADEFDAQMEAEYQAYLKQMKGDRKQILEKEGRIADFSDNEDNELDKANIWQYEHQEGERCTTYSFKGDRLENIEEVDEECPPLF